MHQRVSIGLSLPRSSRRSSRFTWMLCAGWALAGSGCALPVDDALEEASTIDGDVNALAAGGSLLSTTWTTITPMGTARRSHTATRLSNGKVLVLGSRYLTDPAELFDRQTLTWSQAAPPLYHTHFSATATLLGDGRVLVAGTQGPHQGSLKAEIYDPATNAWTSTPAPAASRNLHAATRLSDGRILLAGGFDGSASLSDAYLFDPVTGSWSATGTMNQARCDFRLTQLADGRVLAAGGGTKHAPPVPLASAELFDPQTGSWTFTASMGVARQEPGVALLQNGRVLVTGGSKDGGSSVEIFDPLTSTWAAAAPRTGAGGGPEALTLHDGKVLTAGTSGLNTPSSVTELYDPLTDTWTVLDALSSARREHTLTLLPCGEVLVTGGSAGLYALGTVELLSGLGDTRCASAGGAL